MLQLCSTVLWSETSMLCSISGIELFLPYLIHFSTMIMKMFEEGAVNIVITNRAVCTLLALHCFDVIDCMHSMICQLFTETLQIQKYLLSLMEGTNFWFCLSQRDDGSALLATVLPQPLTS